MRSPTGEELSFMGMFASFDSPCEITTSDPATDMLFPIDEVAATTMARLDSG